MKTIYSTAIILLIILICSCDAYWESQYSYYYLPKDMVFQYDSGDVFIYEDINGLLDSFIVYSEEQYLYTSSDYLRDEHQEYELVNLQGFKLYEDYNSCVDNCRGNGGGFFNCTMECNNNFKNIKTFLVRSEASEYTAEKEEPIYSYLKFNTLWWHDIDNIPGNTYTINNTEYNNSKIIRLKNNEDLYLHIDSVVFNYRYGIIAYRDIETGWYKLKTIEELD